MSTPDLAIEGKKLSGETRQANLLETAVRVFSERGFDGTSLQELAERIGILKGSIYYYYKSKEDILFDVIKHFQDELVDNARAHATACADPLQRLYQLLYGQAVFLCSNIDRSSVLVREIWKLPPSRLALVLGPDHAYQRVFSDVIADAQAAGQIAASLNAKLAALWMIGSLSSLHRWYRPDDATSPEQVAAPIAEQLTRSVAASPLWGRSSCPP